MIGGAALETSDIMLAIMTSPYGSSYSQLRRQKEKIKQAREEIINELKEKQRLYNLITGFKKDGLIAKKEKGKGSWYLTQKGEKELKKLKAYYQKNNLPRRRYNSEASNDFTMVVFDIPEKERRKREWLRTKLAEMKFTMLQKSVWVGKRKIPEQFIEDLSFCKLLSCVEIFTINKSGTLRKLVSQ